MNLVFWFLSREVEHLSKSSLITLVFVITFIDQVFVKVGFSVLSLKSKWLHNSEESTYTEKKIKIDLTYD